MNKIVYDEACRFLDDFQKLPTVISFCDNNVDFEKQFKAAFGSDEARGASNVIYIWTTEKPIKRVRGESQVLYIGKTTQSLYRRHYGYYSVEANNWNWKRYKHILKRYGNIHFYYKTFDKDLLKLEKDLIWSYFTHHLEYPPINARN